MDDTNNRAGNQFVLNIYCVREFQFSRGEKMVPTAGLACLERVRTALAGRVAVSIMDDTNNRAGNQFVLNIYCVLEFQFSRGEKMVPTAGLACLEHVRTALAGRVAVSIMDDTNNRAGNQFVLNTYCVLEFRFSRGEKMVPTAGIELATY